MNKIVCDDVEMVLHRNVQTVACAYHDGLIGREDFYGNLGDTLLGKKPGREGDELIYFNPVGLPVLDVAVAPSDWGVTWPPACRGGNARAQARGRPAPA